MTEKNKNPWKTINKVRNNKLKLPVTVCEISGEMAIAESWRDHYANLMSGVNHPSIGSIGKAMDEEEDIVVLVRDVEQGMKNLSLNSAPGLDGVKGDHLKYAHPTLLLHLSLLFTVMFRHHYTPQQFINIMIRNLVKDQHKSLSDKSNYRPIALASIISKLFERIILQRCSQNLKTSDNQFAHKNKHSTDMAFYLLKQITDMYRTKNTPVFMCATDLSKAFDCVNHKKLFEILEKRKVPNYIIQTLKYWFENQRFQVLWGNAMSTPFSTGCGIRQGSVLSVIVCCIYGCFGNRNIMWGGWVYYWGYEDKPYLLC